MRHKKVMWMFSTRSGRDKGGWEKIKIFSMSLQSFETTRRRFRNTEKKLWFKGNRFFTFFLQWSNVTQPSESPTLLLQCPVGFFCYSFWWFSWYFPWLGSTIGVTRLYGALKKMLTKLFRTSIESNLVALVELSFVMSSDWSTLFHRRVKSQTYATIRGSSGEKWVMCAMHIKAGQLLLHHSIWEWK